MYTKCTLKPGFFGAWLMNAVTAPDFRKSNCISRTPPAWVKMLFAVFTHFFSNPARVGLLHKPALSAGLECAI